MPGLGAWLQSQWWRPQPTVAAHALRPLAALYGALSGSPGAPPEPLGLPVIVVGNLVVGGAGKTPTVIALAHWLRSEGWTPGIVSRGYGRRGDGLVVVDAATPTAACGDEPKLIHLRTRAPVVVGADRVAAVRCLHDVAPQVNIVISDDGLQHHRLHRDVQVIVFDERGAGNGLLLPAGPLRAPLPQALPPRTLLLYNADTPTTPLPGALVQRRLGGVLPLADWAAGQPPRDDWPALQGRVIVAAAGVAAPQRFFSMLRARGLSIDERPLPDHHGYTTLPWPAGTREVIVTENDAVKLDAARVGSTQVWVATLDFVLPEAFLAALRAHLPRPP
jgi:tetraacyldisaccharide 4'-kinase